MVDTIIENLISQFLDYVEIQEIESGTADTIKIDLQEYANELLLRVKEKEYTYGSHPKYIKTTFTNLTNKIIEVLCKCITNIGFWGVCKDIKHIDYISYDEYIYKISLLKCKDFDNLIGEASLMELRRTTTIACILKNMQRLEPFIPALKENSFNKDNFLTNVRHSAKYYGNLINIPLLESIMCDILSYISESNYRYVKKRFNACTYYFIRCIHNNHAYPETIVHKLKSKHYKY